MPYSSYTPPIEAIREQINAISSQYFDNTLRKVVYQESVLLKRMMKNHKVKVKGGNVIQWPLRVKKLGTSGAVDPRVALTFNTTDTRVAAQLGWKFYYGTTFINWDEILMNQGKPQLVDLVKDKSEEIKEDMTDALIDDLYATGAQDEMKIMSLDNVIGVDTYAGIDPDADIDDPTRWKSIVWREDVEGADTGDGALGFFTAPSNGVALADIINSASFNDERPTLIITTEEIYTKIEAYQENKRQKTSDDGLIKLGYDNVKFKNIPVVSDKRCPEGHIFGINEKQLELVVHPDYDMAVDSWKPHEQWPNSLFKQMSFAGNLKAPTRHTHFKITGITDVETGS
jgi:hypothetical protein